jgi:two-component system NtrC family sensor kinase
MISGVAHELNNPLAVIKGYLDLVLAYHELPSQTRSDLDKVTKECTRAIKLVRNFLAFAREQPARRDMVNVNEIIQRVADLHRFEFQIAQIKLVLNLSPSLPATHADPDQIQQLIINLVNNAIHALAEVHGPQRTIAITSSQKSADTLQLRIEDSGPGVPPELETRIFEPFFTTKAVGTGTGLGLSIAHSILSDHHGRIYYRTSQTLGGAGFVLEFPIINGAPAPSDAEQPHAPARPARARATVMVLDDEKSVAEMVCEMLMVLGHEPVQCLSPNIAIKMLDERRFDLIISDFRMPIMNGEEFYRQVLEKLPELAHRIIFLTGDVVNPDTQRFLRSTGNPHLSKPFQLNHLEAAVFDALAKTPIPRPKPAAKTEAPITTAE